MKSQKVKENKAELKILAAKADNIILATDPDRRRNNCLAFRRTIKQDKKNKKQKISQEQFS